MKFLYSLLFLLTFPLFGAVNIVTTIPDYGSIAKEIGKERVKVDYMLTGAQDPHFADPKPSYIVKMNRADLLIFTGLGLESGWLPTLLKNSRNSKIQTGERGYLDASQYVKLKEVPVVLDRLMGDVHPGGNPHFYTSPVELFKVGKEIYNRLISLDPKGAEIYKKNWDQFVEKYKKYIKKWEKDLKKIEGSVIIEYHKSWIYFLNWANLKSGGAIEPKPGISPTTKHIIKLLRKVKNQKIKFVIQEVYHPKNLSKLFAKKSRSKLLVLPSMVGAFGTKNIWDKFDYIIEKLTK